MLPLKFNVIVDHGLKNQCKTCPVISYLEEKKKNRVSYLSLQQLYCKYGDKW